MKVVGYDNAILMVEEELGRIYDAYEYSVETDTDKSAGDFLVYIRKYLRRAEDQHSSHSLDDVMSVDETIVKIAGLCISYLASRVDYTNGS